jgi:hypothetical protein
MWGDLSEQRPGGWKIWITFEEKVSLAVEQPVTVNETRQTGQRQTVMDLILQPNMVLLALTSYSSKR